MAILAILLVLIALIATCLWYYFRWAEERNRVEYARRKVKYLPQRNAFLQVITKERIEETLYQQFKREGNVFGFNFLGRYTICVNEPEIAQLVLSKEFTNFTNRRVICSLISKI